MTHLDTTRCQGRSLLKTHLSNRQDKRSLEYYFAYLIAYYVTINDQSNDKRALQF